MSCAKRNFTLIRYSQPHPQPAPVNRAPAFFPTASGINRQKATTLNPPALGTSHGRTTSPPKPAPKQKENKRAKTKETKKLAPPPRPKALRPTTKTTSLHTKNSAGLPPPPSARC